MTRHMYDTEVCDHESRAGIVTNCPDGYNKDRTIASISVCVRPECRARAYAWVWDKTHEQGIYISDNDRKASK